MNKETEHILELIDTIKDKEQIEIIQRYIINKLIEDWDWKRKDKGEDEVTAIPLQKPENTFDDWNDVQTDTAYNKNNSGGE